MKLLDRVGDVGMRKHLAAVTGGFTVGYADGADGVVNGQDFTSLIANLGKQANGASIALSAGDFAAIDAFAAANGLMADVPEPSMFGLIIFALGAGLTQRKMIAKNSPFT